MTFAVNTSPFMGKEGTHSTSRTLHGRLLRDLRTNVSLRVESTDSPDEFLVSGRGELHLTILVETMRREGFEFQVSKPEPATKVIDGTVVEPYEHLTVDTREEYIGPADRGPFGTVGRAHQHDQRRRRQRTAGVQHPDAWVDRIPIGVSQRHPRHGSYQQHLYRIFSPCPARSSQRAPGYWWHPRPA